jgi:predicted small secreted protein
MSRLIRILTVVCAITFVSGISIGCNTMEGAGKDIEKGGDKLKDTARDAKD